AHPVGAFVTANASWNTADFGHRGAAVASVDHLFAALGSQRSAEAGADHLPPRADSGRPWLVLLTVAAAEVLTVYAAYPAADASERTPRRDDFPLPEEA